MTRTAFGSSLDERRAVRRAVHLEFELWDEFGRERQVLRSRDLSISGVWLESEAPLEPGDHVLMRVRLSADGTVLFLTGVVRRSEIRGRDDRPSGMAVEFVDPDGWALRNLGDFLTGRPPPLPGRPDPTRSQRELVDVRMNVVFEEDDEEDTNVFETREAVAFVEEDEFKPVALGPLLTGGRTTRSPTSAAA